MLITAWHANAHGSRSGADVERHLAEVLDGRVVTHRCTLGLPAGTSLLVLDRGAPSGPSGGDRLLVAGGPPGGTAVGAGSSSWREHQLRILAVALQHSADLVVYLPQGVESLRLLLRPSTTSDRYARLRPSPGQLTQAQSALADSSPALDHAVLALALPGRAHGAWVTGQPVEQVEGCWVADSRSWDGLVDFNWARDEARRAGREHLGARAGGVALVVVDRLGTWEVFDDPYLSQESPQQLLASDQHVEGRGVTA